MAQGFHAMSYQIHYLRGVNPPGCTMVLLSFLLMLAFFGLPVVLPSFLSISWDKLQVVKKPLQKPLWNRLEVFEYPRDQDGIIRQYGLVRLPP